MTKAVREPLKEWMPLVALLWLAGSGEDRLLAAAGAVVETDIRRDTVVAILERWRSEYARNVGVASIEEAGGGILIRLSAAEWPASPEETVAQALDVIVGWAHLRSLGIVSARERARLIAERMALQEDRTLDDVGLPSLEPDLRVRFECVISERTRPETRARVDVIVDPFGRRPDESRSSEAG